MTRGTTGLLITGHQRGKNAALTGHVAAAFADWEKDDTLFDREVNRNPQFRRVG